MGGEKRVSVEVREEVRAIATVQDGNINNPTTSSQTETLDSRSDYTDPNHISLPAGMSSGTLSEAEPITMFKLSLGQRIIAGSGHILNDLCASLWFTYFLLYMQRVVKFNDSYAAGLLFWGQVVDGIATPLVGYETDHVERLWPCKKTYGRCKSWHLLGIVLVVISFPFIFSPCVGYGGEEWSGVLDWKKAVYYAPFIAIFQIGWACTQISHLALIPKLTPDDLVRTEILAIRYACTVAANISVFVMTFLFLTSGGEKVEACSVDPTDSPSFSYIALLSIGLGGIFSILFHIFVVEKSDQVIKRSVSILQVQESMSASMERQRTNENNAITSATEIHTSRSPTNTTTREERLRRNRTPTDLRGRGEGAQALLASDNEDDVDEHVTAGKGAVKKVSSSNLLPPIKNFSTKSLNIGQDRMGVGDWLKLPQFYTVACVYLSTRLAVNLSQSYMPLYLETTLDMGCGSVALIPLLMYCSGFAISLVIKSLNKYLGRQLAYVIGAALIIAGAALILVLDLSKGSPTSWAIYLVAILIGGGSSAILVTSLSITADLIGNNIESGAFVYGAMSFCDKISCGLAVVLISNLNPCTNEKVQCSGSSGDFYRQALGFSSGGSATAGAIFIVLMTLIIMRISKRKDNIDSSDETPN